MADTVDFKLVVRACGGCVCDWPWPFLLVIVITSKVLLLLKVNDVVIHVHLVLQTDANMTN
jgi:hypothetical protein